MPFIAIVEGRGGRWWLAVLLFLVSRGGVAGAQTFYKWTDSRGVVHFSDTPPAEAKNVEERVLQVPPLTTGSASAEPQAPPATGGEEPAAKPAAHFEGPARVVIVSQQAPRTGLSALHISGEVKNVGGADAQRVTVVIDAVDSTQGTPCLQKEAEVSPGTLRPGETGNFDVDIDNPCLFGQPNVQISPDWD